MGMFDYVNYHGICPNCNAEVGPNRWQTKDRECSLVTVEPEDCDNFYGVCPDCGFWLDAKVKKVSILKGIKITARKI
jgi:hypothetical protein